MDHAKEAGKLRKRAEDCRTLAEVMKDPNARDSYLGLAAAYEALAKNEEAMLSQPHQLKDDAGSRDRLTEQAIGRFILPSRSPQG